MMYFLPTRVIIALAIAGALAWLLGHRRLGLALASASIWHWLLWPLIQPMIENVTAGMWVILAMVGLLALPFATIRLFQRWIFSPIFGERAGAHVAATYVVRLIDAYLALLGSIALWPLRCWRQAMARRRR